MQRTAWWMVALLGLALRLALVFSQDVETAYRDNGGDSGWYLGNGLAFYLRPVSGHTAFDVAYDRRTIPTPPLYLLLVGLAQVIAPSPQAALWLIGLAQTALSLATAALAARLALRLTQRRSTETLVFALLALHPAMVLESAAVSTEALYLFWIVAALWWWANHDNRPIDYAIMGGLLACATLTRAVALLFPLVIVLHGLALERRNWRKIGLLLASYAALLSSWTLYNLPAGRFIIASDQFTAAVWRGAVDPELASSPERADAVIAQATGCTVNCGPQIFGEQAIQAIQQDIGSYLVRRANEWLSALLEPHGAQTLGNEVSLRALALDVLRRPNFDTLSALLSHPTFLIEAALYLLWYGALLLMLWGAWRWRMLWRLHAPWAGFIAYTLAIHTVMLALPRYFFPLLPLVLVFAAAAFHAPFGTPELRTSLEPRPQSAQL
ncbi:MAG: hypothetical protein NZ750_12765 [Anaerolineae bacterium]|nr:hypothetical protein [Anaerolineae bacterium]MDW8173647.1 hypothetical protein [Anaerolineae bacterium]